MKGKDGSVSFLPQRDEDSTRLLSQFLQERTLVQAFAQFGLVVGARIPCDPYTNEPLGFGFVSFLNRED